jgi:hypothetical protein
VDRVILGVAGLLAFQVLAPLVGVHKARALFDTPFSDEFSPEGVRGIAPAAGYDVFWPWSAFTAAKETSRGLVLFAGRRLMYFPHDEFSGPEDLDRVRALIVANVRRVRLRKPKHDIWAPEGATRTRP